MSLRRRTMISVFTLIFSSLFALTGGGFLVFVHNTIDKINYKVLEPIKEKNTMEEQELSEVSLDIDDFRLLTDPMVLNILFFGADRNNEDENGRSDSIILMSIDSRRKKLKLTSFMRDMWVEVPGHSWDKLNHAYSYGGESLAKATVERNFGIKIDKFVSIDFEGFKDIIEVLGGIDIKLTSAEVAYINKWSRDNNFLDVSDAVKHLSGKQALCHVRNRTLFKKDPADPTRQLGDDYARASRQRDFIREMFSGFKKCNLGQVLSIISKIGPKISTNFRKSEVLKLTPKSLTYLNYHMEEYAIPESGDYLDAFKAGGQATLEIQDIKRLRYKLAKFIYEDSIKIREDVLNGDFKKRYVAPFDCEFPSTTRRDYSGEQQDQEAQDDHDSTEEEDENQNLENSQETDSNKTPNNNTEEGNTQQPQAQQGSQTLPRYPPVNEKNSNAE